MTDLFEIEAPTTTTSLELRRLQRDTRRRQRRVRTLVASAIGLVVLALGASIAWNFIQALKPAADEVADYTGLGQGTVQIIINPGDDGATIAKTLYDNGVIASERAFLLATYDNPDGALKIQPGFYLLPREMKAEYALGILIDPGDLKLEWDLYIREGARKTEILDKISTVFGYTLEEVQAAAADTEALGLPPEAGGELEGWLFASTYGFNPDVDPADVLARLIETTVTVLENAGVPREQWKDTLIKASIIQWEAGSVADMPYVSAIIQNRLLKDPVWNLEFCSTIKYFIPDVVIPTDAQKKIDNPYNTYFYTGLPPGPINSPSEAAIKAAFAPAPGAYLFMTTVNLETGETRFEMSQPEHAVNAAILHQWCKDNPEYNCDNG
jgi:UPF0755 protein